MPATATHQRIRAAALRFGLTLTSITSRLVKGPATIGTYRVYTLHGANFGGKNQHTYVPLSASLPGINID
jgi:hypothetical protein